MLQLTVAAATSATNKVVISCRETNKYSYS